MKRNSACAASAPPGQSPSRRRENGGVGYSVGEDEPCMGKFFAWDPVGDSSNLAGVWEPPHPDIKGRQTRTTRMRSRIRRDMRPPTASSLFGLNLESVQKEKILLLFYYFSHRSRVKTGFIIKRIVGAQFTERIGRPVFPRKKLPDPYLIYTRNLTN